MWKNSHLFKVALALSRYIILLELYPCLFSPHSAAAIAKCCIFEV
ncbi:hypothetical protein RintRC_6816 [Richelia intracellularis]|nr:hypothetical protein RintRC_6816 [Richelia intracellularis]